MPVLSVEQLRVRYGAVEALQAADLLVAEGEIVSVLGANGAGKSTLLKAVAGWVAPVGGKIRFGDVDITRARPWRVVRLGIALVPEGRRIFAEMSVLDNLFVGAHMARRSEIQARLEQTFERFPILRERRHQLAGSLSGGEQQMLAIGRALMTGARLLMLDEPSLGLAPKVVHEITEIVRGLKEAGMTFLLVEQNARLGLDLCDRAYVLQLGRVIAEGDPEALRSDGRVKKAYLVE